MVLNIKVTSSGLHGVVWFSQTFSVTAIVCLLLAQVEFSIYYLHARVVLFSWVISTPSMGYNVMILAMEITLKFLKQFRLCFHFIAFGIYISFVSFTWYLSEYWYSRSSYTRLCHCNLLYPIVLLSHYVLIEMYYNNIQCNIYLWKAFLIIEISHFLEHPYISDWLFSNFFPPSLC